MDENKQNNGRHIENECVRLIFNNRFSFFNVCYGPYLILMPSTLCLALKLTTGLIDVNASTPWFNVIFMSLLVCIIIVACLSELFWYLVGNIFTNRAATFTCVNGNVSCFRNKHLQNWPTV